MQEIKKSIVENADRLAREVGIFVEVNYKIPAEKVDELNAFVEKLLGKE